MNRTVVRSLMRYLVTGGLSLTVDMGGLVVLHQVFGIWAPIAATISFLASFAVNFTLNRNWSFAADEGAKRGQLLRFTSLVVANSLLVFTGMTLLTGLGMNYLIAKTILVVMMIVVNFFVLRGWVFAKHPDREAVDQTADMTIDPSRS